MAQSTIKSPYMDEVVTLTVDRTIMPTGDVYCIKRNGWCYIQLSDVTFAADGDSQLIITGCPKAYYQVNGVIAGINSSTPLEYDACWINGGGSQLYVHIGSGNHEKRHWINLAYPYIL